MESDMQRRGLAARDAHLALIDDAGPLSAKLLKNGTLKTYKGFPHGMPTTEAATINADLLAFIMKSKEASA
jgi:non-heme chloroperoxidase